MTNKKYFFYIVSTIPCDMIKKFILKTFKVRKIHYERKLALFLKKSDIAQREHPSNCWTLLYTVRMSKDMEVKRLKISSFELVCILQYNVMCVRYMYIYEKVFDMDLCQK